MEPDRDNIETKADTATLMLPRALRIEGAEPLYAQLEGLLASDAETVVLDASAVEQTGTAGIQLLLSFHRSMRAASRHVVLTHVPQSFSDGWAMLGLTDALCALHSHITTDSAGATT